MPKSGSVGCSMVLINHGAKISDYAHVTALPFAISYCNQLPKPKFYIPVIQPNLFNRPLAPRGHATNASFKQWVGILLMPKIDGGHKNDLTTEI